MRPNYALRIVLIALEVHTVGDAMAVHRNVTIETDPRLQIVDPKSNALYQRRQKFVEDRSKLVRFIFETSTLVIRNVQLLDGSSGRGGFLFVSGARVHTIPL